MAGELLLEGRLDGARWRGCEEGLLEKGVHGGDRSCGMEEEKSTDR